MEGINCCREGVWRKGKQLLHVAVLIFGGKLGLLAGGPKGKSTEHHLVEKTTETNFSQQINYNKAARN